jgi:hypothetical protein
MPLLITSGYIHGRSWCKIYRDATWWEWILWLVGLLKREATYAPISH